MAVRFLPAKPRDCPNPLPCPFCGGDALEVAESPHYWRRFRGVEFRVVCNDCPGRLEIFIPAKDGYLTKQERQQGLLDVVEAWNRRAVH